MPDEVPRDSAVSNADSKNPRATEIRPTNFTSNVRDTQQTQISTDGGEDARLSKLRFDRDEERATRITNTRVTRKSQDAEETVKNPTQLQLWIKWVKENKFWVVVLSIVGALFFINLVMMSTWYAKDNGGFPRNFDFNTVCPLTEYSSELKGCCNILTKTDKLDATEDNYIQPCLSISLDGLILEANLEDFGLLPEDQSFDPTRVENRNGVDAFLKRNQCPPRFRQATLTRFLPYYQALRHVCCDKSCDKWTYTRVKQLCNSCQSSCPKCD